MSETDSRILRESWGLCYGSMMGVTRLLSRNPIPPHVPWSRCHGNHVISALMTELGGGREPPPPDPLLDRRPMLSNPRPLNPKALFRKKKGKNCLRPTGLRTHGPHDSIGLTVMMVQHIMNYNNNYCTNECSH